MVAYLQGPAFHRRHDAAGSMDDCQKRVAQVADPIVDPRGVL